MAEQLFFHDPHSSAAQSTWPEPEPERIAIQPQWNEGAAETIQIRLDHINMATRVCRISFKPVYRQGHDTQLLLGTGTRRVFASWQGKRAT
jgi:hypothetical protein